MKHAKLMCHPAGCATILLCMCSAVLAASCGSETDEPPPAQWVVISAQNLPSIDGPKSDIDLTINPKWGDYWFVVDQKAPLQEGELSDQQLSDLRHHVASASDRFEPFRVDKDRCLNRDNNGAYELFINTFTEPEPSFWMGCIVPAEVTGPAKEHVDYLVNLFRELTGHSDAL